MDTRSSSEGAGEQYSQEAISLLEQLIALPSFSGEEDKTADLIYSFLTEKGVLPTRKGNNIYTRNTGHDEDKPTILLNAHHDTVKPNRGYTRDPFLPEITEGKLYGLGSNDAGGCLVALIMTFLHFREKELPYNLTLAATGEEEISGHGGVSSILDELGVMEFGLVGEPTEMQAAVAEKGLMVLDCVAKGEPGHAAYATGKNAVYEAMKDIRWIRRFSFQKISPFLGKTRMTVTRIEAGTQHNVIPDRCHFVVDVRVTEKYSLEEVLSIIKTHVNAEVTPRSLRLKPSILSSDLPVYRTIRELGVETYGSSTMSDRALMPFPTFKMGPGKSRRSHTADEFIYLDEIKAGISGYIHLLEHLFKKKKNENLAKGT